MWIFTTFGLFSVVQKKPQDTFLTVRARVSDDLDRLRQTYLPELSDTIENAGTDYPYRATIGYEDFALGLARIAKDIHYGNFKDAVAVEQGHARAHAYERVWSDLRGLERDHLKPRATSRFQERDTRPVSYGGVVFDDQGKVLLREPRGHFGGYVWTFPKGRSDPGESAEQTALREVREETGIEAGILAPIPGNFRGSTTDNTYFLMAFKAVADKPDRETASICWVTTDEAAQRISQTIIETGRARDLAVLKTAVDLWHRR